MRSAPQVTVHVFVGLTTIEEYDVTTNGSGGYDAELAREFLWGSRFPEPVAILDSVRQANGASR